MYFELNVKQAAKVISTINTTIYALATEWITDKEVTKANDIEIKLSLCISALLALTNFNFMRASSARNDVMV